MVPQLAPLGLGMLALGVLILVAVWEWASLGAGHREPA